MKVSPKLARLKNINGYSVEANAAKETFHSEGRKFLKSLAKEIGMPEGSYEIRSNKAGMAVSGEVTLHGETLYVQLSESVVGRPGVGILYRTCEGRKDYRGGNNNWAEMSDLARDPGFLDTFINRCKSLGGFPSV